jgi:GNAT superfamily N-acetyltransferase
MIRLPDKDSLQTSFSFQISEKTLIKTTINPDDPLVDIFFEAYDRAFVLPNEKEDLAGFKTCLALNFLPRYKELSERYGAYREAILVAFNSQGELTGGANFVCFPLPKVTSDKSIQTLVSCNLNYIFISPEHRGRGYFRILLNACKTTIYKFYKDLGIAHHQQPELEPPHPPVLIFSEQNNPYKMSAESYQLDSQYSGIDQIERLKIWGHVGSKILKFPYVQPPLSPAQQCDNSLIYSLIPGNECQDLDPRTLKAHLERFFGISVLKGASLGKVEAIKEQFDFLDKLIISGKKLEWQDTESWLEQEKK